MEAALALSLGRRGLTDDEAHSGSGDLFDSALFGRIYGNRKLDKKVLWWNRDTGRFQQLGFRTTLGVEP